MARTARTAFFPKPSTDHANYWAQPSATPDTRWTISPRPFALRPWNIITSETAYSRK